MFSRTYRQFTTFGARIASFTQDMSRKVLVLADVDGEFRMLSMRSNGSGRGIEKLSRQMAGKLLANHNVGDLWVEPWPEDDVSSQPSSSVVASSLGPAHHTDHGWFAFN